MLTAEREWLLDNIVGSAAPDELAAAIADGRRITLLVHYFPADDPALSARDRQQLAAAESEAVAAASTIVTTSAWAGREVSARYGRDDVVVAVPGVDPAPLAPGSARNARAPMLLWLGRVTETKDPRTFVDALGRLRDLDWTARIVGPHTVDPSLTGEVRDRIRSLDLTERIHLPGPLEGDALESVWQLADLLVHTSRAETFGMVIAEALAHGVPSIVATGTGAVEAQQGVGASFEPGDAEALAEELRGWLTDVRQRDAWRAAAAEARRRLHTWHDTAQTVSSAMTG